MRSFDTSMLLEMLRHRRPHGSVTESVFIDRFIMPLNPKVDAAGNLIVTVGKNPRVLWSCHTDTVHAKDGYQMLTYGDGIVSLAEGSKSNCLGADDTAGVFLMIKMIEAKRPGLYIFHRGEECGGIGSSYIARETPEVLNGIDFAIALDRKGQGDIITHQFSRCCSDAFADSLAEQLTGYMPSQHGIFTDTANYTELVPECTNLSIGYEYAHSANETLDVWFLEELLEALLKLDTDKLVVARSAGEVEDDYDWFRLDDKHYHQFAPAYGKGDLATLVKQYPDLAADILERVGYDEASFQDEILYTYGSH